MSEEKFPRECATCQYYDNMEGYCKKFKQITFYASKCKHYKVCDEFKETKKALQPAINEIGKIIPAIVSSAIEKNKGLEALERIGKEDLHSEREDYCFLKNVYANEYNIIETALKEGEINKEALKILALVLDLNARNRLALSDALESGWITKDQYNLVENALKQCKN